MKVLLINPPNENEITAEVPSFLEEERGCNPPLGLLYVAAYAERNTGHEVEVLDAIAEGLGHDSLKAEIGRKKPDIVGISAMTFTLVDAILTARSVKGLDEDIPTVFGGPHASIYPAETIRIPEVDFLVRGEGDIVFTELLKNLDDSDKLKRTKGVVFEDNGKIVDTGDCGLIKNLDELPFPARRLTPYKKYSSLLAKRSPVTTMFTSRGCPYNCLFCNRGWLGKIFRARSAGNVVDEMEECVEMGIREFLIYDDTFTVDRKRVLEICSEIGERKLDVGWDVRARVDTVDPELLRRMGEAGCERIHYGVESGNQEILDILRKGINLPRVEEAFRMTRKAGISTLAYFMLGSPRETKETVMQTINFAKKINPDYVHFSLTTPFPATELYRTGIEEGVLSHDYWRDFAANPRIDFVPELWEENLPREELIECLKQAYKSFYARPGYILKRMLEAKSPGEVLRKARAGLKVLGS